MVLIRNGWLKWHDIYPDCAWSNGILVDVRRNSNLLEGIMILLSESGIEGFTHNEPWFNEKL